MILISSVSELNEIFYLPIEGCVQGHLGVSEGGYQGHCGVSEGGYQGHCRFQTRYFKY